MLTKGLVSHTKWSPVLLQNPQRGPGLGSYQQSFSGVSARLPPIADPAWWCTGFRRDNQVASSTENSQETSSGLQGPTPALFLCFLAPPSQAPLGSSQSPFLTFLILFFPSPIPFLSFIPLTSFSFASQPVICPPLISH